jgi:4-amino-4-deoxy-L-arabinose transferase-like glycosyltransferase
MKFFTDKFLLIGLMIFTLLECLTHYGQVYPDSPGYFAAAHFFQGREAPGSYGSYEFRLLRPVIPFLASLVNYFTDIRSSFAIVNLALWCANVVLMFYFTKLLTKSSYSALFSSALFTSAIPMLLFGDAVLTDMGGFFFILLCTYLVIRWDSPRADLRRVSLMAALLGLGILTRESVASALIFALVWTLWSGRSITRTVILALMPLAISLGWSHAVGVSYVAWYAQGGLAFAAANQPLTPLHRILRLGGSIQYDFGWSAEVLLLGALGLLGISDRNILKTHVSIWIGAFAVILAWPIIDNRFTFVLFPSIFPLAGVGLVEAYRIIFKSKLVQEIYPSFSDSSVSRLAFLLFVVAVYALITNAVLRGYVSFPWAPYTSPGVKLTANM